jgi:hypothetical protein
MHSLTDLRNLITAKYHRICVKLFQGWQLVTNRGTFELGPKGFSKDGVDYSSEKELHLDLEHLNHLDQRNRPSASEKIEKNQSYGKLSQPFVVPAVCRNGFAQVINEAAPAIGQPLVTTSKDPMPAKRKRVRKDPVTTPPATKPRKTVAKKKPVVAKKTATKKLAVKKAAVKKSTKKKVKKS